MSGKKNLENFAHNFIIAQNTLTLVQVRVYNLNVIVKKKYMYGKLDLFFY